MADSVKNLEFVPAEERAKKVSLLVDYFTNAARRNDSRNYLLYFIFCQYFYLLNTAAQVYFTDAFLNEQFLMLVPKWLGGEPILDRVFPMQAKCKYVDHGVGGDLQSHDLTCVLAMNVLIRKLYLLLWFLLAIASIVSVFQAFFIIALLLSTTYSRRWSEDKELLEKLDCTASDCLLLKFLKESVDCVVYDEFTKEALARHSGGGPEAPVEKL